MRALQHAERLVLDTAEGRVEVRHGRMVLPASASNDAPTHVRVSGSTRPSLIARWIGRPETRVRIEYADGVCASELPRISA